MRGSQLLDKKTRSSLETDRIGHLFDQVTDIYIVWFLVFQDQQSWCLLVFVISLGTS
jgi:hypothetical protein